MKIKAFFFVFLLVALSCSSENEDDQPIEAESEPLEQVDPQSAALYPAKQKAEASDFEMATVSGEQFRLSDHKGKVVIMNIWATWCNPCHDETPDFVELYDEFEDDGLLIVGVSIDEQGKSVVEPFMEKYNVDYPIIIDNGVVMDKYGPTMGIPTNYIIDKEGDLRYFATGALTNKELRPKIERLLKE